MNQLTLTRLPFSTNRSVGGFDLEAQTILSLSGGFVYLLCSDGCEEPFNDDLIEHKLEYYLDKESYFPLREDGYDSYFSDFIPKFYRLYSSNFYQKYNIPEEYTILKIDDVKTLNFFLTTENDEEIHIFSSDYSIDFLKTYLNDYYDTKKNFTISSYKYLLKEYKEYVASKKFIMYDTYSEDEDSNYCLICSDDNIAENNTLTTLSKIGIIE